ncbi:MAG: hypothetical protein IT164_18555 [Bryobacterales bacterium]|nr:hypothetical protein [Bryobacterales bacterium]
MQAKIPVLLLLFTLSTSAQVLQWARQFGTNRAEYALAVAVSGDAVYVAGETAGAFEGATNAGGNDCFVRKFDSSGNHLWTRQFGVAGNDSGLGLAADASGVYVAGQTQGVIAGASAGFGDAFVRKYDPDGNELWTRQFGTSGDDSAMSVAVHTTGVYVSGMVTGALPGQVTPAPNQADAFLRKYDASGNEVWTRQFGTVNGERGRGVAADASGIYITGETGGALVSAAAGTDSYVRKYDASGTVIWTRQITSQGNQADIAYGVAVHSSGVYVTGDTVAAFTGQTKVGGLYDAWVRKFDLNGGEQWTRQFGTTQDDHGYGIAVARQWVYVALNGDRKFILKRFDLGGGDAGQFQNSGSDSNFGQAMAADQTAAYLAGSKNGPSLEQTPLGDQDALLLKFPHPPEVTGISDSFNGQVGVAPTTWITIYGNNLSPSTRTWDGAIAGSSLPATLDGVSASINGKPATLYFISPLQVNVLGPLDDATGNVPVTVTTSAGTSPPFQVRKAALLPAFYAPFGEGSGLRVTAVALDGTLVGKGTLDPRVGRPARPGEILQFFATGFGPTNPPVPTDSLFLGAPEVVNKPVITIGGRAASILGNGNLVSPGLYQFNITIPDLADGDHAIVAETGGVRSPANVFLTVGRQ